MAMNEEPVAEDPLARALQVARSEPTASTWSVLADDVMARARAVVRSDETVLAAVAADGGRTFVSTRVMLAAMRRTLGASADYAPDDVGFRVDGRALLGVDVSLVAAFRADLVALAREVRGRVLEELRVLVPGGPGAAGGPLVEVDVAIVDVVDGDPRRV